MNSTNNKNHILIYDKSELLIKLVKHYCGSNVDVIFCNCKKKMLKLNLKTINTAYVSSVDRDDLLDIVSIYVNVDTLYLNTESNELKEKLEQLQEIFLFDLNYDKFKIMNQIFHRKIEFA